MAATASRDRRRAPASRPGRRSGRCPPRSAGNCARTDSTSRLMVWPLLGSGCRLDPTRLRVCRRRPARRGATRPGRRRDGDRPDPLTAGGVGPPPEDLRPCPAPVGRLDRDCMTAAEHEPADAPASDRPRETQSPKPVVVGYDGSPSASAAVDWAAARRGAAHTGVRVLTAVDYSSVPVWPGATTEHLRDVALERATAVADEGVSRALSVRRGRAGESASRPRAVPPAPSSRRPGRQACWCSAAPSTAPSRRPCSAPGRSPSSPTPAARWCSSPPVPPSRPDPAAPSWSGWTARSRPRRPWRSQPTWRPPGRRRSRSSRCGRCPPARRGLARTGTRARRRRPAQRET